MYTELHWVEGPWPGRLAVSARPRGGDWLDDELASWRHAGIDEVVSLLMPDEVQNLDLESEAARSWESGMEFHSFPIIDRSIPASRTDALRFIDTLDAELAAGKNISIHCPQGIGRASLIATSLLVARGMNPDDAFERVGRSRGIEVPETAEQRAWVEALAVDLAANSHVRK